MIHFHSAQSLNTLTPVFAEKLSNFQQCKDPFSAPWIIVQNKETETWLHSQIAAKNSISANLDFILPNQFVFKLYRQINDALPKVLPSDRVPLQWILLSIFDQQAEDLRSIGLPIPSSIETKIALAGEIADVFDLYQIYRPEMLSDWQKRKLNPTQDNWQVACWQLLVKWINRHYPQIPLRSEIPALLIDAIKRGDLKFPEEIFIVGISHWNCAFNNLIAELSESCTIHWFQQKLIIPDSLKPITDEWIHPQIEVKKTLFETLNQRSLNFEVHHFNSDVESKVFSKNGLSIHSCHNPKREVEVLYQKLLTVLDENPSFSAEDILILVPELDEYLPHLEAVFSDQNAATKLPIQTFKQQKGQAEEVILKVLKFFSEGEKVTQFLDVLSSEPVKDHFKISDDFLVFVEKWFEEMHIHNGLKESDSDYSIEKGVLQLFEGLLLKMPAFQLYQNHVPFALPLRNDAFHYVSQLHGIYRTFEQVKTMIEGENTIQRWLELALTWSSEFLTDASALKKLFTKSIEEVSFSNSDILLSFDVFRSWITEHLFASSASATQFGTGIQVSSYIPYRNIPFKFTAILGLNENIFPRNPKRPNFDLIHQNPQPGDRITKLDDQLLFLERLLSTQHHVHISYLGEGDKGNLVSPVIQQLKDSQIEFGVSKHKLHAFDEISDTTVKVYPTINTLLTEKITQSGKSDWKPVSKNIQQHQACEIQLNDLILFFVDPAKYICTSILGLSNVYDDNLLTDRQLFKLDGLQKYKLRARIEQSYPNKGLTDLRPYLKSSGELPKGFSADKTLLSEYSKIEKMSAAILEKYPDAEDKEYVELKIGEHTLSGSISNICNQTLVRSQLSSVKGKHIIKIWIEYLAAQSCTDANSAELFAFEKDQLICHRLLPVNNPVSHLTALVEHFVKSPLNLADVCIEPNQCWEFVSTEKNEYLKSKKMNELWEGSFYSNGLKNNYYNQLLFGEDNPALIKEFQTLAKQFYLPIVEHWAETKL